MANTEVPDIAVMQVHKIARAITSANKNITATTSGADGGFLSLYYKPTKTLLLTVRKKEDYVPAWAYLAAAVTDGKLRQGSKYVPIKISNKTLFHECAEFIVLSKYMSTNSVATVWPILYSRHVLSKNQFSALKTDILKLLRKKYGIQESCIKIQFKRVAAKRQSSESYRYMKQEIYVLVTVRITAPNSIATGVTEVTPYEKAVLDLLEKWNARYKFSYIVNGRLNQSNGKALATKNQTLIAAINILRQKLPNAVIVPEMSAEKAEKLRREKQEQEKAKQEKAKQNKKQAKKPGQPERAKSQSRTHV